MMSKKTLKTIVTILTLTLFCIGVNAQSIKLKQANTAFEELDYQRAIELYNQALSNTDDSQAKINLAISYQKVSNTEEAEYWYGQVVNLAEAEPIHYLSYGMMLQTNGKCELAKEWYNKYVSLVPDDLRGQYLVKACDYADELRTKNAGIYEVTNLDFNTAMDDFSPVLYKDGLIYSSEYRKVGPIKREHTWTGDPFLELMYVPRETKDSAAFEYVYKEPTFFSKNINTKYHDAAVTFADGGKTMLFTRNNYERGKTGRDDEGIIRLKVFQAQNTGGDSWGQLESLPFNSDQYSVAHPSISKDGSMLVFASDMPGGFGGMDIYLSKNEGSGWGQPVILPLGVNTEGNEIFPGFGEDGKLYFSSNGHVGLGGLDVYYITFDEEGNLDDKVEIVNLGYPINTESDDFSLVINEESTFGYFSSDRTGGKGDDDIYSFIKKAAKIKVYVYDAATDKPIEAATVLNNFSGVTYETDEEGFATFEMKLEECFTLFANKAYYNENSKEACTKGLEIGEELIIEIPLYQYTARGYVLDRLTNKPIGGAKVTLYKICDSLETEVSTYTTDATGFYSFKLDDKDCCYKIRAEKMGEYLADVIENICPQELDNPIAENNFYLEPVKVDITDSTRKKPYQDENGIWRDPYTGDPYNGVLDDGRRVRNGVIEGDGGLAIDANGGAYLLHIYYDFDQSYIRDDAIPELEKVLRIMQNNPEYVVEIGSHTDSRGSHRYNDRLSQRRAESVVRWLTEKGISKSQLRSKGYGETINVNNCSNNIPCSEKEHQLNRRTEFKVLGYYDANGDYQEIQSSAPNESVRVDPCQGCPF